MTNQTITPDAATTPGTPSGAPETTATAHVAAARADAAAEAPEKIPTPTPVPAPAPVGGYSSAPAAPSGGVVAGGPEAAAGASAAATFRQYYSEAPRTNTLGIVTLVLGILGFGLVPVITGHIALGQIKKNREDGYGITLAGLILGYVTLAGWLLVAAFWIGAAGIALFGALAATAA
jgi:hypothetical protein